MKIKITTSCSGLTFSFSEGQTVDVTRKEAKIWFSADLRKK